SNALNFIKAAIRYEGDEEIVPQEPHLYSEAIVSFNDDYQAFKNKSRTYEMLDLLEEKSSLEVDEDADDLLPSIDLLFGYNVKGKDWAIKSENNMAYLGVSMDWPFPDQVERAEYEAAKIVLEKTKLSTLSTHFKLYTDIKNLSIEMGSEKDLLDIAKEKIGLAKSVLEDETENYSFGKITLNDYIDAVNVLDNNRFNEILHNAQYYKLLIEWLRITDQLISKEDIQRPIN
ncbi:TolC family protein, partial [Candidatus Omnitrophota bacterium]